MLSNPTLVITLLIGCCSLIAGQSTEEGREKGILITGGLSYQKYISSSGSTNEAEFNVELFSPSSGTSKIIAEMHLTNSQFIWRPQYGVRENDYGRYGHTVDVLDDKPVICGGYEYPGAYTCIEFVEGSWKLFTDYRRPRQDENMDCDGCTDRSWHFRTFHNSWLSSAGLVLVGGRYNREFFVSVRDDPVTYYAETPDIVTRYGVKALPWFSDQDNFKGACSTTAGDSLVITGGFRGFTRPSKWGARYNLQGLMETLPDMNNWRGYHGCGSYTHRNGSMVIIVAGGMYSLGTTEGLVLGPEKCKTWMRMNPLPRVLWFIASVNLNNKIYIIGGKSVGKLNGGNRAEVLELVNGEDWDEIGKLNVPRIYSAAAIIDKATMFNLLV